MLAVRKTRSTAAPQRTRLPTPTTAASNEVFVSNKGRGLSPSALSSASTQSSSPYYFIYFSFKCFLIINCTKSIDVFYRFLAPACFASLTKHTALVSPTFWDDANAWMIFGERLEFKICHNVLEELLMHFIAVYFIIYNINI